MHPLPEFAHVNRNLLESIFGIYFRDHKGFIECRAIKKGVAPTQYFYKTLDDLFSEPSLHRLDAMNKQGYNIFFGVCPRVREQGKKEDVAWATTLWADLDAKDYPRGKVEARDRLANFAIAPSAIVDSGHGYHAYWFLSEMVDVTDPGNFEGYVKAIAHALGSDAVHDVSRVLRLPGFINVKDADKPLPCAVWDDCFFPERRYSLQDFAPMRAEERAQRVSSKGSRWASIVDGVSQGSRNTSAAALAGKLIRSLDDDHTAWDILELWNTHRNKPPMEERELVGIFLSILKSDYAKRSW